MQFLEESESTHRKTAPGILTFHGVNPWHWPSLLCECVCACTCACACLFPFCLLTIQLRKYVRIKAGPLGSLWSVHRTFRDNTLLMPEEAYVVSERATDPWKGVTAPGVVRERHHGHVALDGECCSNMSALTVGGQRSGSLHHSTQSKWSFFSCLWLIDQQLVLLFLCKVTVVPWTVDPRWFRFMWGDWTRITNHLVCNMSLGMSRVSTVCMDSDFIVGSLSNAKM